MSDDLIDPRRLYRLITTIKGNLENINGSLVHSDAPITLSASDRDYLARILSAVADLTDGHDIDLFKLWRGETPGWSELRQDHAEFQQDHAEFQKIPAKTLEQATTAWKAVKAKRLGKQRAEHAAICYYMAIDDGPESGKRKRAIKEYQRRSGTGKITLDIERTFKLIEAENRAGKIAPGKPGRPRKSA